MKKFNLLLAIAFLSLTTVVRAGVQDYIITEDNVKYYEKVRYGLTTSLIGIDDTGRVKYNAKDVKAFRKDGRIYERMPVFLNNQETGRYAFMELLSYRNDLKVFRYNCPSHMQDKFFVYRDGNYMVEFDKTNSSTLNDFFFGSRNILAGK